MQLFGHQFPQLSLRRGITLLEDSIITLSGPAIAISGVIAGIDLLTGGSMFKDIAWLSLTWAICLLLTLDFQVLMLGARARRVYGSSKSARRKLCEILIVMLIAAAISSVSVQMQSIIARSQATVTYSDRTGQHVRNLTIDEATRDMGINPVALVWERSALVLILIFMSGWFRDEERSQEQQITATTQSADLAEQIREAVRSEVQAIAQSLRAEAQTGVQVLVQQNAQPTAQIVPVAQPAQSVKTQITEIEPMPAQISQRAATRIENTVTEPALPAVSIAPSTAQTDDTRQRVHTFVKAYQQDHGKAPTLELVMASCGVAKNTAVKYRKEVQ